MNKFSIAVVLIVLFVLLGFSFRAKFQKAYRHFSRTEIKMKISADFSDMEKIPSKYTCDGEDSSPKLSIYNVPRGTKSLALIIDDPDAPGGTFTHWVVFNIPPATETISSKNIPEEASEGLNDFGGTCYGGPCPPSGEHRYFFKLYALDSLLELKKGADVKEIEKMVNEHLIEKAELVGLYSRK